MELTTEQRQAAFAFGCTHYIQANKINLVRRHLVNIYEFGNPVADKISWYGTPDLEVSDLAPINFLGTPQDEVHCQKLIQGGV